MTDSDGRVVVPFVLDPEEGIANNAVEARIDALPDSPVAGFVTSGRTGGDPAATAVAGLVLDNTNQPIAGVTIRIRDTALSTQTGANGLFRLAGAPVGTAKVIVDGSTAARPGSWPDLEYDLTTVPGRDNTVNMPIYLLPLDQSQGVLINETRGGTLTLPEMPGFALEIAPGSVTFPDGSRSGLVSATPVHGDKIPMVPGFGQQPRFIVTIQPAGARFDPPARMTLPNVEGLAPGQVTEMYSFDHDLGHFVSIGPATVGDDGRTIVSNPGVGVLKAGWHCGGDPAAPGTPHDCPDCMRCTGVTCVADSQQTSHGCDDHDACTINDACDGQGHCQGTPFAFSLVEATGNGKKIATVPLSQPQVAFMVTAQPTCPGPLQVKWTFGDGQEGSGVTTTHTYAQSGVYQAKADVTCPPCPKAHASNTVKVNVIDVKIQSAAVTRDEIVLTASPAGVAGKLTLELTNPDQQTIVAAQARSGGSLTEKFNLPGLQKGEHQTVKATWEVEGGQVANEFSYHINVLGRYRHSVYKTLAESACRPGQDFGYLDNAPACTTFPVITLRPGFLELTWINGSGISIDYGTLQASPKCPASKSAPKDDAGRSFHQVAEILPACGIGLSDMSVAVCLGRAGLQCGDQLFVDGLSKKTVTDKCPACCKSRTWNGGDGHIDDYETGNDCKTSYNDAAPDNRVTIKLYPPNYE